MYSGIGIASQSNGCSGFFLLFLFRNSVNRTHPKCWKKSQEGNKNLPIRSKKNSSACLHHSRVALTPNTQGVLVTKERLLSTPKKATENIEEYINVLCFGADKNKDSEKTTQQKISSANSLRHL